MIALTICMPDDTGIKLSQLATKMHQTTDHVAIQAIEDFVRHQSWELNEIEQGLLEAERGEFVKPHEIAAVLNKYAKKQ